MSDDHLRIELAKLGREYVEPESTPYADRLRSRSSGSLGTQINLRDKMIQRLRGEGVELDEPVEAIEPELEPAPAPVPPTPTPASPTFSRGNPGGVVPHANDVTLMCITVWDNWGGTTKPPVVPGQRTPPLQWGVTIELWTDPADQIPTRSTDRMKLVTLRATTRLLSHEHLVRGVTRLQGNGSISADYLARLTAHHRARSYPGLRTGTFQEQTGTAGTPYIHDTDCFIEMDVRGSDAPYSCKLHLNGGTLNIRPDDWSDVQMNGAALPSKGTRSAKWQCRFDRDGNYGSASWRTK